MKIKMEKKRFLLIGLIGVLCTMVLFTSAIPGSTAYAVVCQYHYKVQAGDTINTVASLYNVNWKKIADANNLTAPYTITPGMNLCIPDTSTTNNNNNNNNNAKNKNKKAPKLEAVGSVSAVTVGVQNFAPKTVYYVRLSPSGNAGSYRIGHLLTNKEGNFTGFFQIPIFAKRTREETLCVKNVWTDDVSCVTYIDPYYIDFPLLAHCSGGERKVGR